MKFSKRAISSLLIIIMMVITPSVSISANTSSYPTTHPNTYKNTGNGAVDITEVAKTQVGYKENSVGTKYGYWYNETFVNQPWCAMFVSWCADQAGISTDIIEPFASCSTGVRWFKAQGIWQDSAYYGGSYVPKKGDIIFYRNNGSSNLSDHVGVVLGVNGTYINVIEGNATNETCCEFKTNSARTLDNKYVIGYGVPNYEGSENTTPEEGSTKYELWQITSADTLSLRKSYNTSAQRLTTIPQGTVLQITDFKSQEDYLWGYTNYNGTKGWCALDFCTYIEGNIDGTYYQLPPNFTTGNPTVYVQQTTNLKADNALTAKYTTSNVSIARVSTSGKIRGMSKGTATITCTTPTGKTTCKVTVINPVLETKNLVTTVGKNCEIKIKGLYEEVTYESLDTNIATVESTGVVTGVSEGTTTIVATTAKSGLIFKTTIAVSENANEYQRFKVVDKNTYLADDYQGNNLVKIPKDTVLKVTKVKYSDTFTWGFTTYNNKKGWVILNNCEYIDGKIQGEVFKVAPYLTEIKKTLYLGDTYNITVMDASSNVTFESKQPEIATVNSKGLVKALKAGTVNIVAKVDGVSLNCKITVKNPSLNKKSLSLIKGKTATLTVRGGSGAITFKSSAPKIVSVSKDGVVTAKKYGTAIIKATRNGVETSCEVKVYSPVISQNKITIKKGEKKTLTVSKNLSNEITWKTSNKKIVRVNKKGGFRGMSKGKATITASVDGKVLSCVVTVK